MATKFSRVSVPQTSRMQFSRVRMSELDNFAFFELPEYPNITPQADDILYQLGSNDDMYTLATKFYRDPSLWWVIALANGFELLPTDMLIGSSIRIPSPTFVLQRLFKSKRSGLNG